jgi:archaellum component FlaC
MFEIYDDMTIHITRGDSAYFQVTATKAGEEKHIFRAGDALRIKVFEKKACENVLMQKDFGIEEDTEAVAIYLDEKDTRIGEVISKPKDYWYEVELNPLTEPQTIIGYDDDGAKVFRLYPEGADIEDVPIEEEDIPIVDAELDVTSPRPVQNMAIASAFAQLKYDYTSTKEEMVRVYEENTNKVSEFEERLGDVLEDIEGNANAIAEVSNRVTSNSGSISNLGKSVSEHKTSIEELLKDTSENADAISNLSNELNAKGEEVTESIRVESARIDQFMNHLSGVTEVKEFVVDVSGVENLTNPSTIKFVSNGHHVWGEAELVIKGLERDGTDESFGIIESVLDSETDSRMIKPYGMFRKSKEEDYCKIELDLGDAIVDSDAPGWAVGMCIVVLNNTSPLNHYSHFEFDYPLAEVSDIASSEVKDARVDVDGTLHDSIGGAVRSQINALNEKIVALENLVNNMAQNN